MWYTNLNSKFIQTINDIYERTLLSFIKVSTGKDWCLGHAILSGTFGEGFDIFQSSERSIRVGRIKLDWFLVGVLS